MANRKEPTINPEYSGIADTNYNVDANVDAENNMHTAVNTLNQELLANQIGEHVMSAIPNEITNAYADPNPNKNPLQSSVHTQNMQKRLEAEGKMLITQVNEVDRKIAELQAERTDLMRAYSMINHGLIAGE